MKNNRYTLMFVLAAACSTAHAQDAFRNLALVEATEGLATSAPPMGAGYSSQPVSTSASNLASTLPVASSKDVRTAPIAHTLVGGGDKTDSRPAYEGRSRRIAPAPEPSTKGGIVDPVAYDEGDSVTDLTFQIEAGYHSRFIYHGLDHIRFSSGDQETHGGAMTLGASATWNGFFLGYKYVLATEKTSGRYDPSFRDNYTENVFEAGYSLGVLPKGWLDLTASYQYAIFKDKEFWGNGARGRIMLKAEINRYQWFRPSIAYYDFSGYDFEPLAAKLFEGEQLIAQIRGGGQIFESGPVAFGFGYYVLAGMDNEFNTGGNDFGSVNYYQAGISFPIVYKNLTIEPSFNYNEFKGNTQFSETWVGLNAAYRF